MFDFLAEPERLTITINDDRYILTREQIAVLAEEFLCEKTVVLKNPTKTLTITFPKGEENNRIRFESTLNSGFLRETKLNK